MMTSRILRRPAVIAAVLVMLATGSCSVLKDKEPFQATVVYDPGPDGRPVVHPLLITGDANFGAVSVVNNTGELRGFAIDDLAVFEEIPSGQSRLVQVNDTKDGRTYVWYDQTKGHEKDFHGKLVIKYVAENER